MDHFEQRLEALDGKAMVVCMSRRICVDLYKEIMRLRPAWHDETEGSASKARRRKRVVQARSSSR